MRPGIQRHERGWNMCRACLKEVTLLREVPHLAGGRQLECLLDFERLGFEFQVAGKNDDVCAQSTQLRRADACR